jgi:hypothetical protein
MRFSLLELREVDDQRQQRQQPEQQRSVRQEATRWEGVFDLELFKESCVSCLFGPESRKAASAFAEAAVMGSEYRSLTHTTGQACNRMHNSRPSWSGQP